MTEPTHPNVSNRSLLIATLSAIALAAVVLISFVLPAEYNVDPTGIGKAIGLTQLSEPAQPAPVAASVRSTSSTREDSITVDIIPGKGLEFKLRMAQGAKLKYSWSTDGGPLEFDFHGEPKGDTTGYFESYTLSKAEEVSGSFTATFDGSHGWYWENKSAEPITVTLETEGEYEVIGFM